MAKRPWGAGAIWGSPSSRGFGSSRVMGVNDPLGPMVLHPISPFWFAGYTCAAPPITPPLSAMLGLLGDRASGKTESSDVARAEAPAASMFAVASLWLLSVEYTIRIAAPPAIARSPAAL